ncbi:MAG: trypsin-like peptidase domain-containing protein, partial [Clostridia bacterium]|nr:trypsin-like peptidase domain-containing protein [Clostridia bacterium]
MSEYDPKKGMDGADRSSSEHRYRETDPDGREYINPDGSHGYVYNAGSSPDGDFNYRKAFITALTALVSLTVVLGCLVGAWLTLPSVHPDQGNESSSTEDGTSEGLHISDETANGNNGAIRPFVPGGNINSQLPDHTLGLDSITKLPARRVDEDGDGRPDVVFGEDGQVLTSAGTNVLSVATVVARVADSVVEITTGTVSQSGSLGHIITSGSGSGVIISSEGYIITNHHVIEGADRITVRLTNGTEFSATLVGTDEKTDIAVIRIDPGSTKLTVAVLGASFDLMVGEDVIAIGNPLGSLGGTVTEGMVSATARQIQVGSHVMTLLQTSAPVNPGNSGGGLFNLAGELVGIVNAKVSADNVEGLGFAVPVDTVYKVILELIHYGYVRGRPALDFAVVDISNYREAYYYFQSASIGVFVY